ncbi:hypothetical protein FPHYL_6386 [Fusarium phyllophilum]|uniref:Uncharacterized protein n=1 Tax=Fusarium phyllophilum TaxID=47803 RepID=A0A8H5NCF5_9HYPO|nr:hypothetical protein FPHYL_6386 [Fusarium phyllophilum]
MPGYTSATQEQKSAAADMIKKMMNPSRKPDRMSFTMGWDVIATYSEEQINKLLSTRHQTAGNNMLQELAFEVEEYDQREEEYYTVHFRVKFGAPLLQFDSKATASPMCSLTMPIVSGTTQVEGSKKIRDIEAGWSLTLNNIPLATAAGEMSAEGSINGNPEVIPGTDAVHFPYGQEQTQHVVLGFDLDKSKLVVTVKGPGNGDMDKKHAANQSRFQDAFKEFFVGKPADNKPRSLSYSIASVNNKVNPDNADLTPSKFQFATYFSENDKQAPGMISIFIEVSGGPKQGQTGALQERWKTQWHDNKTSPVPSPFTASLIISSVLFKTLILRKGFERSKWSLEDRTAADDAFNKLQCTSQQWWSVPEQNYPYGISNIFHLDGFALDLKDWPMMMEIRQEDVNSLPTFYAFWQMKANVHWENTYQVLGIGSRVSGSSGDINVIYTLCDEKDHSKYRKLDVNISVTDEAFSLGLNLDMKAMRMDQREENGIDYDIWAKGMAGLWTKAPNVSISAFGIGFLRTTNLLMPGKNVIDFNEEIGLRAPKDLVLVGDVEKL